MGKLGVKKRPKLAIEASIAKVTYDQSLFLPKYKFNLSKDSVGILHAMLTQHYQQANLENLAGIILIEIFFIKFEKKKVFVKHKMNLSDLIKKSEGQKDISKNIEILRELYSDKYFSKYVSCFDPKSVKTDNCMKFYKTLHLYFKFTVPLLVKKIKVSRAKHPYKKADLIHGVIIAVVARLYPKTKFRNLSVSKKAIINALKTRTSKKVLNL